MTTKNLFLSDLNKKKSGRATHRKKINLIGLGMRTITKYKSTIWDKLRGKVRRANLYPKIIIIRKERIR